MHKRLAFVLPPNGSSITQLCCGIVPQSHSRSSSAIQCNCARCQLPHGPCFKSSSISCWPCNFWTTHALPCLTQCDILFVYFIYFTFPYFSLPLNFIFFYIGHWTGKNQMCIAGFKKCTANLDGLNLIIPQHNEGIWNTSYHCHRCHFCNLTVLTVDSGESTGLPTCTYPNTHLQVRIIPRNLDTA